jgi:hypothetical protein
MIKGIQSAGSLHKVDGISRLRIFFFLQCLATNLNIFCHSGKLFILSMETAILLACTATQPGRPMFRRNIQLPSLGSKMEPRK